MCGCSLMMHSLAWGASKFLSLVVTISSTVFELQTSDEVPTEKYRLNTIRFDGHSLIKMVLELCSPASHMRICFGLQRNALLLKCEKPVAGSPSHVLRQRNYSICQSKYFLLLSYNLLLSWDYNESVSILMALISVDGMNRYFLRALFNFLVMF